MVLLNPSIQLPQSMQTLQSAIGRIETSWFSSLGTTVIPPFLGTLNRTHPTTVRNRINDTGIQPFVDHLFNYLLHRWIEPSLMLNTRLVISHELNIMRTNTGRYPNNIRNSPPNRSFKPFQHIFQAFYFSPIQICHNDNWQHFIFTQDYIPQVWWQGLKL